VSSETDPDGTTTTFTYNGAGEVTSQVVSFGSYSATTQYGYDSYGHQFCTVGPYEYAEGVTCPSSAPTSPPTPGDDAYLGATITTYDADGRVVQVTNPLGGMTYTAYDQAGEPFCTVAPAEADDGVTCPSTAPSTPPTIGDDPYLGATITSYDANGRSVQVTNPLGGITLTTYDAANNVLGTTVESNNSTSAPLRREGDALRPALGGRRDLWLARPTYCRSCHQLAARVLVSVGHTPPQCPRLSTTPRSGSLFRQPRWRCPQCKGLLRSRPRYMSARKAGLDFLRRTP
jgi:YD repeat-containing protein